MTLPSWITYIKELNTHIHIKHDAEKNSFLYTFYTHHPCYRSDDIFPSPGQKPFHLTATKYSSLLRVRIYSPQEHISLCTTHTHFSLLTTSVTVFLSMTSHFPIQIKKHEEKIFSTRKFTKNVKCFEETIKEKAYTLIHSNSFWLWRHFLYTYFVKLSLSHAMHV